MGKPPSEDDYPQISLIFCPRRKRKLLRNIVHLPALESRNQLRLTEVYNSVASIELKMEKDMIQDLGKLCNDPRARAAVLADMYAVGREVQQGDTSWYIYTVRLNKIHMGKISSSWYALLYRGILQSLLQKESCQSTTFTHRQRTT